MREKAKKRQRDLNSQLQSVRMAVADEMGKAYKKGDINKCLTAVRSKEARMNYCIANFVDDFNALSSCKEGDDFCNVCCDNEFGDFYANERQSCYQTVCKAASSTGGAVEDIQGRWIWQNGVY